MPSYTFKWIYLAIFLLYISMMYAKPLHFDILYLDTHCNDTIDFSQESRDPETSKDFFFIKYSDMISNSSETIDCEVFFTSKAKKSAFLAMERIEIPSTFSNCSDNYLLISSANVSERLCGNQSCPSGTACDWGRFTTEADDPNFSLHLVINKHIKTNPLFAHLTVFEYADGNNCPKDTFKCSNGHCIVSSLTCNNIDNCGDRSDEADYICKPKHSTKDVVIGVLVIMFGIISLLLFLPLILYLAIQGAKNTVTTVVPDIDSPTKEFEPDVLPPRSRSASISKPFATEHKPSTSSGDDRASTVDLSASLIDNQMPPNLDPYVPTTSTHSNGGTTSLLSENVASIPT